MYHHVTHKGNNTIQLHALMLLSILACSCSGSAQVIPDEGAGVSAKVRPIDVDTASAEKVGREALEKIGYEEIIRLAAVAQFVDYKAEGIIRLASYESTVASGFAPVFSRYAVAAAVTSQADSPLPGPADVAAVGVIVLGLVDAGLLHGYVLNSIADWAASGLVFMSSNVVDTGVMQKVESLMAQAAAMGTPIDPCTALEQLYDETSGTERLKVQATQKGLGCRNKQKRR